MSAAGFVDDEEAMSTSSSVSVVERLRRIDEELAGLASELVPERVAGHLVAGVVRLLRRIERRAGGARLLLAETAARSGVWRAEGFGSAEEWMARSNGTTVGEARGELRASRQLAGLPGVADAVAKGEMSAPAAKAAAEGASADPSVEGDLVDSARKGDLEGVRSKARRARQRRDERDGRVAKRMHARRALRMWVEVDGEGRGTWNVPPGFQAVFDAALKPYRDEAFRLARESGQRPSNEALMADAMYLAMTDILHDRTSPGAPDSSPGNPGGPARPGGRASAGGTGDDADAPADAGPTAGGPGGPGGDGGSPAGGEPTLFPAEATNGHRPTSDVDPTDDDSTIEIDPNPEPTAAGGPGRTEGPLRPRRPRGRDGTRRATAQLNIHVDLDALRRGYTNNGETCEIPGLGPIPVALARDLANDAVLHLILTGTDVTVISSHRRYIPADIDRALRARDRTCVVGHCNARHRLQRHHWPKDFAAGCPTELATLALVCPYHHHLITHCGWTLTGGPDSWQFNPPGHTADDDSGPAPRRGHDSGARPDSRDDTPPRSPGRRHRRRGEGGGSAHQSRGRDSDEPP